MDNMADPYTAGSGRDRSMTWYVKIELETEICVQKRTPFYSLLRMNNDEVKGRQQKKQK